jgi:hypothetical protein
MVVQTNWHAAYQSWKVGARDSRHMRSRVAVTFWSIAIPTVAITAQAHLPNDTPIKSLGDGFVCAKCGRLGADGCRIGRPLPRHAHPDHPRPCSTFTTDRRAHWRRQHIATAKMMANVIQQWHARSSLFQLAVLPRGGLTPAEAPLIDAEILFRQPQPPHWAPPES